MLGKGHVLYTPDDFTPDEINSGNTLAVAVVTQKLAVCKKCGQNDLDLTGICIRSTYYMPPAAPPAAVPVKPAYPKL